MNMHCGPCARDQHEDCQVSHMGFLQAFCQCWCRDIARQDAEEERAAMRVGDDGVLTLQPEPKPCLPVECPPEVATLLGVPDFDYDQQAETAQGPPA